MHLSNASLCPGVRNITQIGIVHNFFPAFSREEDRLQSINLRNNNNNCFRIRTIRWKDYILQVVVLSRATLSQKRSRRTTRIIFILSDDKKYLCVYVCVTLFSNDNSLCVNNVIYMNTICVGLVSTACVNNMNSEEDSCDITPHIVYKYFIERTDFCRSTRYFPREKRLEFVTENPRASRRLISLSLSLFLHLILKSYYPTVQLLTAEIIEKCH